MRILFRCSHPCLAPAVLVKRRAALLSQSFEHGLCDLLAGVDAAGEADQLGARRAVQVRRGVGSLYISSLTVSIRQPRRTTISRPRSIIPGCPQRYTVVLPAYRDH